MNNTKYNQLSKVDAMVLLKIGEVFPDKVFTTLEIKQCFNNGSITNIRRTLNSLEDLLILKLVKNNSDLFDKSIPYQTKSYVITLIGTAAFIALSKIYKCSNMFSVQDRIIDLLIILNNNKNNEQVIIKDVLSTFCNERDLNNTEHNSYYDLIRILRKQLLVDTSKAHKCKNGINISISDLGKVFLTNCLELNKLLTKESV